MMVFIGNGKKLHVSAYSGHLQILTTFLLKEFYIKYLNRVVMLRSHHRFTCFCYAKFGGMSTPTQPERSTPSYLQIH